MQFDENQLKVIEYGKGNLLVEAGPGSGKTTVIIERIKHLLNIGVEPESFLIITFTRKAAENLKNKLKEHVSKETLSKMRISTIHSFCLDYLRSKDEFFTLLDDDTSEKKDLFIQKFKNELGFTHESTVLDYQIPGVMNKYGEYTSFNVNTEELTQYIKENRPISKEYFEFVDSLQFFSKKRVEDEEYKKDWYNARFLRVAEAYPKYLELLDKYGYVDYDTAQLKTLEYLRENSETRFKTILIDEFQDTDPLQFRIFELLMKHCDYFTGVGDVDQHIYAFRSSFRDYFKEMNDKYSFDIISLNVNYRSTQNIVDISDSFIKHQRDEYSKKELVSNNDKFNNPNFIIESHKNDEEAHKIFNIIKTLKEENKIKNYSDVAVLSRKNSNKTITKLIDLFIENDVGFTIKGLSDLDEKDEIKSFIIMLWYIIRKTHRGYIPSNDELDTLNLKAFCGEYFNPTFWSLSKETRDYLNSIQDSFLQQILKIENQIRVDESRNRVKAPHRVRKNEDQDTLIKIFSQVDQPLIDVSKITNEEDKEFFIKLEELREEVHSLNPPKILEVFYRLLSIGDSFIEIDDVDKLKNLAKLSQTCYNYETFISNTDTVGLFYFLTRVIRNYNANYSKMGVQIMTVHSSKGLEFPVTIVTSLNKNSFPLKVKDPNREKDIIFIKDTFYTPNECLEYKKDISLDEENELEYAEEERIIYVAMTRASDLLILSCIGEVPPQIEKVRNLTKELETSDLKEVTIENHFNSPDEKVNLNYSKYSTYKLCPYMYNLIYNMEFKVSDDINMVRGIIFHNILDEINQKLRFDIEPSEEEILEIIEKNYQTKFVITDEDEEYDELCDDILDYVDLYSEQFKVLDSEVPFFMEKDNYTLNGIIDLIYKIKDNEIGLLDYKNTDENISRYSNYAEQLKIYASALSQIKDFEKYDIKEAKVYAVKSGEDPVSINISEDDLNMQMDMLDEVALKIKRGKFNKNKTSFCNSCKFSDICRGEIDG